MAVITTIAGLPGLGGVTFEPSPWVRIDAGMVRAFAQLTGDHQWIHVDEERTAAAGHGLVAHGYLLLSLIPSLSDPMLTVTDEVRALNYGLNKVRFLAIVFSGARVRLIRHIHSIEAHRDAGFLVANHYILEIEGGSRPALVADALVLHQ